MVSLNRNIVGMIAAALVLAGCVTTGGDKSETLETAASPVWALDSTQRELIVAVSPARQTLQMGGLTAGLLGAGISAISDSRHRRAVMEVLEDYNAGAVFEAHLAQRIDEELGGRMGRVSTLGSTAGYKQQSDAEKARYQQLARQGHDLLMDLDITYGIFGFEGTLVTKIDGVMLDLPRGGTRWRGAYVVSSQPILANDSLSDPTRRLGANFTNPRFSVDENAISQWTGDGGVELRSRYEQAVTGVVSAMLTDLGLVDEAIGHHYLGFHFMNKKDFEKAAQHYRRALSLDPSLLEAKNGLSVNLAHNKQVDEAIALAEEIVAAHPDHAAAHFNLAWWYAVEKKDEARAAQHYDAALALGMYPVRRIDRFLDR